jgi:hypothetical protein
LPFEIPTKIRHAYNTAQAPSPRLSGSMDTHSAKQTMDTHSAKHERRMKSTDRVNFQLVAQMVENLAFHFFRPKNPKNRNATMTCIVSVSEFCTASSRTPTIQKPRKNPDTLTKHGSKKSIAFWILAQKVCGL